MLERSSSFKFLNGYACLMILYAKSTGTSPNCIVKPTKWCAKTSKELS